MSSYVAKKNARFLQIGPPPANEYVGFTLSNFTRSSDAPVTWLTVVFCAFHWSLANRYLNAPSNRLVPDLVMTLTIAPWARPYSAPTADVSTLTSWIASKFKLVPNVPVVGSVVSTASITNRFDVVRAPELLTLPVPTTPGAAPMIAW